MTPCSVYELRDDLADLSDYTHKRPVLARHSAEKLACLS
jgi:hypothetical protein